VEAVERAAELLMGAKRPVIVAGDAVAHGDAHAELQEVAELCGAPVYTEGVANTCNFPASHPLYRGPLQRLAPAVRAVLARHDLLFSVGGDLFTLSLPSEVDPMPPDLPVIHLDLDPWEIGKNYPAKVAILGDPKATLPELARALRARMSPSDTRERARRLAEAREERARAIEELRARAKEESARVPMAPLVLMKAVADNLPPDAVVVEEAISSGAGLHSFLKSEDPKSFFGLRGGGIGWGLPAAIGVKLAQPGRPVVALVGDGSAMYTNQSLWTAAHYALPVVFVILNNRSYRILKQRLYALKGTAAQEDRYIGMDLEQPAIDFVGLAAALGVPGERIERSREVGPALARALGRSGPSLIEVMLDKSFKP
jgi:benzoylformate decarboxylase